MVRVLMPVARGIVEVAARRSTTSTCAPCRSAATAVARPAGPAPTTSTSVVADGVELGVMRSGSPAPATAVIRDGYRCMAGTDAQPIRPLTAGPAEIEDYR